jgi:hypothetical protein
MSHKVNVMLDLETLGTKPGCKILQISAVTFGANPSHKFNRYVIRNDQAGLLEDPSTIDWWMKQDPVVRDNLFNSPGAVNLIIALLEFKSWLEDLGAAPVIWGNGATFDGPVLEAAYKMYTMSKPWDFRNERCYRTLVAEFGSRVNKPEFIGSKHDALDDARYQAEYADRILKNINGTR